MKFSFKCPKCNSNKVIEVKGSSFNNLQKISLSKWAMVQATLDRYLCADCGYTEEYIQLNDSFKKWAKKELDNEDRRLDEYV